MTFLSSYETKGIFDATLNVKEDRVGVSDSYVILALNVATWVWMSPLSGLNLAYFCIIFIIGLFMLQLFDELHHAFTDKYFHCMDCD